MKNKIKGLLIISLILFAGFTLTADEKYCHISLLEKEIIIIKPGGEMLKGIVNLPIYAGDIISTGKEGRCEIQFGNGTVMRLDKKTELRVVSTLVDLITSKKKITTLKLTEGSLFSMNQVYKGEIFQVITPEISVKMNNRSSNLINVDIDKTSIKVVRGKVGILYGNQQKMNLRSGDWRLFPKRGKGSRINGDFKSGFYEWNKKINKNFKNLHYGKSNVPDVIYRYSPGIVHFAEKWSTQFGEWEYTELFGYVWKPAKDIWFDKRPFFDANFVKINNELVMVPNQKWGWAPAHMGNWFWSTNQGWIWIPGSGENENLAMVPALYKAFMIWTKTPFGLSSYSSYFEYLHGLRSFHPMMMDYADRSNGVQYNAWMDGAYLMGGFSSVYEYLIGLSPYYPGLIDFHFWDSSNGVHTENYRLMRQRIAGKISNNKSKDGISSKIVDLTIKDKNVSTAKGVQKAKYASKISNTNTISFKRDWNPDSRLVRRTGLKVSYNPKNNVMNYSAKNISSKNISAAQKFNLRQAVFSGLRATFVRGSNGKVYGSSGSSSTSSSSASYSSRSGTAVIASTANSGSSSNNSSQKK
ncbi:MAG: FecR family protein [Acidobacteriota bacterium]